MSESAVRVDLRQANLSESAHLREVGDRTFLALDQPPPVRSLLKLTIDDEQKAFEVGRVIEVVGEGEPARGCYGAFVDLERLGEQAKVGSEHLQPGISGSGIPSPVVIMSTAEMMLGEAGGDESEAEAEAEAAVVSAIRDEQWEGSSTDDEGSSTDAGFSRDDAEPNRDDAEPNRDDAEPNQDESEPDQDDDSSERD
jgi:hypothetical protein